MAKGSATLQDRLAREISGDVLFDSFSRGRYATDASFYQIVPAGVVVPRTMDEALRALAIARDAGRIVTPRGGGTSQCGQTVNDGIVVDFSKHLNRIVSLDVERDDAVQVFGEIDHDAVIDGLAALRGAAAARRDDPPGVAGDRQRPQRLVHGPGPVSYTHLRAHETD